MKNNQMSTGLAPKVNSYPKQNERSGLPHPVRQSHTALSFTDQLRAKAESRKGLESTTGG